MMSEKIKNTNLNWNLVLRFSFLCVSYLSWNSKNDYFSIFSSCNNLLEYPGTFIIFICLHSYVYVDIVSWNEIVFRFKAEESDLINFQELWKE